MLEKASDTSSVESFSDSDEIVVDALMADVEELAEGEVWLPLSKMILRKPSQPCWAGTHLYRGGEKDRRLKWRTKKKLARVHEISLIETEDVGFKDFRPYYNSPWEMGNLHRKADPEKVARIWSPKKGF